MRASSTQTPEIAKPAKHRFSSRRKSQGFTLVELLVATMLLTIVMTAVYTLFFSVIQSWRSIENDQGFHRKARNAFALIRREYNNAYPPAAHLMEGSHDELTFFVVAPPMHSDDRGGPHLMRVRYQFHRSRGELEREEALVEAALPSSVPDPDNFDRERIRLKPRHRFIVARGLKEFGFNYVWMPLPDTNYRLGAPVEIEPLVASYHRLQWGFPQALDLRLAYQDGDSAPYRANVRLLSRVSNAYRWRHQLEVFLGDAL